MQPIAPDTPMRCPLCQVLMTYHPKAHYWECPVPNCRLQVWPPVERSEPEYESPEEMFRDLSRPPGGMVKRGSRESAGRKRKKLKRRWPWRREGEV